MTHDELTVIVTALCNSIENPIFNCLETFKDSLIQTNITINMLNGRIDLLETQIKAISDTTKEE